MSPYPPPGRLARKWQKLRRDPVRFFADARSPLLRKAGLWALAGRDEQASDILDRIRDGTEQYGRWITPAPRPQAPAEADWRTLIDAPPIRATAPATVDVIVPVHGARDDTLACLHSVLSAPQATPHELIVIDDASPDPALSAELSALAAAGLFTLIRNADNLGFVRTANKGMALHADRDVVLLNSDTMLYGDWLDRLHRHAVAAPDVATVTPLSNNATICGYPRTNWNNNTLLEADHAGLDALAAQINRGRAVEAPTGVGFCLYIRRECLDSVGLFDAARYGRGYGEENDLCQRAIRHGMRNLIATDIFVRHTGEVSFADTARRAQAKALERVAGRFPDYHGDIQTYIARDPLAPARRALDVARLANAANAANAAGGVERVLFVTHGRGGGVERHIRDSIETLAGGGAGAILLHSRQGRPGELTLNAIDDLYLPNLNPVSRDGAVAGLADILRDLNISRIQIHSLADWPADAVARIPALAAALGVPYTFMIHDYLPICPRINLIDDSGLYCGEKGEDACRRCLATAGSPFGAPDIVAWRAGYAALLGNAGAVHAPSRDAARRIEGYFAGLSVAIRPHDERLAPPSGYRPPTRQPGEALRVAVIGAIGPHKGSALLLDCARDALARKLPLEFALIGTTDNVEALAALPNVTVTGRYEEAEVWSLIAAGRCHMAFLPAVWPETYSYTLTIALAAGLPVAAFDLGAPAERLRAAGAAGAASRLLPFDPAANPAVLNDALLAAGGGDA